MTLGNLIETLKAEDPEKLVPFGFDDPHSYRGDYSNLAFQPRHNTTVGKMLGCAMNALGKTFEGYKGGEYEMGEWVDVYLAHYGDCGEEIGPTLLSFMLGNPALPKNDE